MAGRAKPGKLWKRPPKHTVEKIQGGEKGGGPFPPQRKAKGFKWGRFTTSNLFGDLYLETRRKSTKGEDLHFTYKPLRQSVRPSTKTFESEESIYMNADFSKHSQSSTPKRFRLAECAICPKESVVPLANKLGICLFQIKINKQKRNKPAYFKGEWNNYKQAYEFLEIHVANSDSTHSNEQGRKYESTMHYSLSYETRRKSNFGNEKLLKSNSYLQNLQSSVKMKFW